MYILDNKQRLKAEMQHKSPKIDPLSPVRYRDISCGTLYTQKQMASDMRACRKFLRR